MLDTGLDFEKATPCEKVRVSGLFAEQCIKRWTYKDED